MRDVKYCQQPEILYGRRKMAARLDRGEFDGVSKHTIDRLKRFESMNGLVRGREPRCLRGRTRPEPLTGGGAISVRPARNISG